VRRSIRPVLADRAELVIVIRSGKVLTKGPEHPDFEESGPIPTASEVEPFIIPLSDWTTYGPFLMLAKSIGEPPEGWLWMEPIQLQEDLTDDSAAEVGEVLLCA
jgi:hypothetical protein